MLSVRPFSLFSLLSACATVFGSALNFGNPSQQPLASNDDLKVPVVLGVMSRCPDAILCENLFDQVLKKVSGKVEMELEYIAKVNPSDPDFGVDCLHGPLECAGNVHQLCVKRYAPDDWWHFVHCNNFQGKDNIGTPGTAFKCAKSVGIDWETSGVGECAGLDGSGKGAEGVRLLHESIVVAEELGLEKSCTVVINGEQVCIHDGTWKECENGHTVNDFVRQINEQYEKINMRVQEL
ncbi:hypothetical protein K435DRAFT_814965 [Dendrothele bispora CBS 962.96]|uniref:GILT-domain-containing protein n=1 Tax=Dendrothele bispora (strain CBS 962.96) TaxID=1314807 RepID=A0A4S8MYU6_DENBC|nr:hypothetical protein K435DRAFT_814965 [Dendrothele bispora CBS 962.96]